jgi:hypothetical protein
MTPTISLPDASGFGTVILAGLRVTPVHNRSTISNRRGRSPFSLPDTDRKVKAR